MIKYLLGVFIPVILIFSMILPGKGMAQEITGFEVLPENPSNSDEIILIVHTAFPFLDCRLDSLHTFYACGAFSFDGFYNTGFDAGECESTDTIQLGSLPNGPYMLSYRMYYLGWSQVDQVDTFITVGTTGLDHLTLAKEKTINIWPNPSTGHVNIDIKGQNIDRLRISNISGSMITELLPEEKKNINLDDVYLPPGLYLCTAFNGAVPVARRKFIIIM